MLFESSFRIFFLLACVFAACFMLHWILIYPGFITIESMFLDVVIWHGHEMVYGFITAVLTGFLLTAVATWTSTPLTKGLSLIILALVWTAGRFVMTFPLLPDKISSLIDLVYIPLLIWSVTQPLIVTKNVRNYIIILFLGLLFVCNLIIHLTHYGLLNERCGDNALYASIGVILLFITLIAGRVIPFFTVNGLKRHGLFVENTAQKNIDSLAIAVMFCFVLVILYLGPTDRYTGYVALISAVVHGWRMRLWHTRHSIVDPLLWILHLGYIWMIVGMALWFYSTVIVENGPINIPLHIITIGCIGSVCLGMMARVALGHTGRPLETSRLITLSFILLQLSVIARLLAMFMVDYYIETIAISGVLWLLAFTLYGIVYTPILYLPRVDETLPLRTVQDNK